MRKRRLETVYGLYPGSFNHSPGRVVFRRYPAVGPVGGQCGTVCGSGGWSDHRGLPPAEPWAANGAIRVRPGCSGQPPHADQNFHQLKSLGFPRLCCSLLSCFSPHRIHVQLGLWIQVQELTFIPIRFHLVHSSGKHLFGAHAVPGTGDAAPKDKSPDCH